MLDKYMSRVRGKLSVPKTQCSMKLRLKMEKDGPAYKEIIAVSLNTKGLKATPFSALSIQLHANTMQLNSLHQQTR